MNAFSARLCLTAFFALVLSWTVAWPLTPIDVEIPPDRPAFREVWAYLSAGEESAWNPSLPITDLAIFAASLNSWGELSGVPTPSRLSAFRGRKHLVLAVLENQALTHFALLPGSAVRSKLLDDLVAATAPYDGLQLDFESVTARDKEAFWSFLTDLKRRLESKVLSVAVPARTSLIEDAYDYRVLDRTVDRVIVMAYDEHWSGSSAGPVASLDWTKRVARFAQTTVGPSHLVLGLPFYARAWADKALARAYRSSALNGLLAHPNAGPVIRKEGVPSFEYSETVKVRVFFDDRESHRVRLDQFAALGVLNLACWRLGQESPDFWSLIRLASDPRSH